MAFDGTLALAAGIRRALSTPPQELVEFDLEDRRASDIFFFRSEPRAPDELFPTREWRDLASILARFKAQAVEQHIVPVVIFIPTKEHVYGSLTTGNSGRGWLQRKDAELAAEQHTEEAVSALARGAGLAAMSLTPVFKAEAARGVQLYYPFDSHWNSAGREVAARYVARAIGTSLVPGDARAH